MQIIKHSFAIVTIALIFGITGTAVYAENSTNSGERMLKSPIIKNTLKPKQSPINEKRIMEQKAAFASKSAERKEEMASKAAQLKEDRCKIVTERINLNVTRFEASRLEHVNNYQNAKKRLEQVIAQLKKEGLDTTKLETDLVELDRLIKQFATDYTAYITALKNSKNFECGNSQGDFKSAVENARTLLMKSKQSALAVRNYYQNTIRPDILAIKQQRKASTSPRASTSPVATSSAQ